MKKYKFYTNCIHANGYHIQKMKDGAIEIQYETMLKQCDMSEFLKHWSVHIKDDYQVSFYKSKYNNKPCYFFSHSSIEYIFLKRE